MMLEEKEFHTNISGKIRNTRLPKTKALWPLFELISNSIHAIEERGNFDNAKIDIQIIRNGDPHTLATLSNIDNYPVKSFVVIDNGIGFTDKNFTSFLTAESDYKIEKGAKGIGRFVALKAFKSVNYHSYYEKESNISKRSFKFIPFGKGIFDYKEEDIINKDKIFTKVSLNEYRNEYQKFCPTKLEDLAEKIVEHFLIYFIQEKCPYIKLCEVNNTEISLQNYYSNRIKGSIKKSGFTIGEEIFNVALLKVFNTRTSHNLHYCANEREVKSEALTKFIPDLGKSIVEVNDNIFVYHAYITSTYLDENVDSERTGFLLTSEDEEESDGEITISEIRKKTVTEIEELLSDYLKVVREQKFNEYEEHIYHASPQFKTVLKYNPEAIKRMPPQLKGNKLDIELFRVQNELEVEVKELGEEILNTTEELTSTEEYLKKYSEYIEKFNDLGKANLAKYIVHRKAVIDLLDKFIGMENESFQTEETIHNIFFPIRSESDEINYDKQNLWLIDERLAYHNYLASDKRFSKIKITNSESLDRPDLLIFNDSFAFVNDDAPHKSYTIVEFKRPERKDYTAKTPKKNPVDQVLEYIKVIRSNQALDRKGKEIHFVGNNVPFYVYIILDYNKSLGELLDEKDFKVTPDGMGYFRFHDKYNAYMEVITYQKLLKDARCRNRILFDRLGLPTN